MKAENSARWQGMGSSSCRSENQAEPGGDWLIAQAQEGLEATEEQAIGARIDRCRAEMVAAMMQSRPLVVRLYELLSSVDKPDSPKSPVMDMAQVDLARCVNALARAAAEASPVGDQELVDVRAAVEGVRLSHDGEVLMRECFDTLKSDVSEQEGAQRLQLSQTALSALSRDVARLQRSIEASYDRLVRSTLRLAASVARRFYSSAVVDREDLMQIAAVGLLRAAQKFDYRKGYRFTTYATPWVRQHLSREVTSLSDGVTVPVHKRQAQQRVRRKAVMLRESLGREPTPTELAKACNLTLEHLSDAQAADFQVKSLDAPIEGDPTQRPLYDTLADPEGEASMEALDGDDTELVLDTVLDQLPDQWRRLLTMRYGLEGSKARSTNYIARRLGLSQDEVESLEGECLAHLQNDPALCDLVGA